MFARYKKIWLFVGVVLVIATFVLAKREKVIQVTYKCENNKTIKARFYQRRPPVTRADELPAPTGSVNLWLSDGREFTLPQTISASGIRYANADESIIFWSKGEGAFIVENDAETYRNCTASKQPINAKRQDQ